MPCRRRAIVMTLLATTWLAIGSEVAAQPRTLAVVRVLDPSDEELLERVRGQTVDLDVELRVERAGEGGAGELDVRLAEARTLARDEGARIVVWFATPPGAAHTTVFIAETGATPSDAMRLLVRRIAHGGGEPIVARSAAFEAAALVVRSSIKALAAGGRIGVETKPAPPPPVVTAEETAPLAAPVEPGAPLFAFAAVGWAGAITDGEIIGHSAVAGRLGVGKGAIRLSVDGAFGVDADYADPRTVVHLSRHRLVADLEYARTTGSGLVVGIAGGAGAVWIERETDVVDPTVMATPDSRTLVPVVTAALRLRYRPTRAPIVLELTAGAEAGLRTAHFGYELDGSFVDRTRMWPVSPRLGIALVVEGAQ